MVAITGLVAIVLLVLGLVLGFSSRQRLEREIEDRARSFAQLAVGPICKAYETYYESGRSKFEQLIGDVQKLNPDLVSIEIYDTSGRLLFDSSVDPVSLAEDSRPGTVSDDPRVVAATRGLGGVEWRSSGSNRRFTIVQPYVEEWGRHRYSVAFRLSYESLGAASRAFVASLVLPTAASLGIGVLIAMLLARQSLGPLEQLIAGARDIGSGRLDRRIVLASNDEFEDLALTLNRMAGRLATSIVELEESNLALQQSNVELKELDRLKSDLLANVSHELRTPLTSVQGYTEAMAEELLGPVNRGQLEALEVCQRNIDRLLRMIGDLLTFSRLESERLAMERRPVDLAELSQQTAEAVRSVRGADVDLRVAIADGNWVVDADAERIGQVIENLLTNAVKFTPDGGTIELRLLAESEMVCVEVSDQGIGIDPAEQSRIFDRFYQVESSSTRRYGGIGLGLAIVKQILDAHGSGIEVESEVGQGTTFRFRLPRPLAEPDRDLALTRILVVDPDVAFSRELTLGIERRSWAWRVVPSAEAARLLMLEDPADAVVLDRLLPDGDGFDLVREWREHPETRQLPLVVVSERADRSVAEGLGVAFLGKPIAAGAVVERLGDEIEPANGFCGLVVAERVDAELREATRSLRDDGFWWVRARETNLATLFGGARIPDGVLFDGRQGPVAFWDAVIPLAVAASLPLVALLARGSKASVVRAFERLGGQWIETATNREELRAIFSGCAAARTRGNLRPDSTQ